MSVETVGAQLNSLTQSLTSGPNGLYDHVHFNVLFQNADFRVLQVVANTQAAGVSPVESPDTSYILQVAVGRDYVTEAVYWQDVTAAELEHSMRYPHGAYSLLMTFVAQIGMAYISKG